jgi:hypothetical protein
MPNEATDHLSDEDRARIIDWLAIEQDDFEVVALPSILTAIQQYQATFTKTMKHAALLQWADLWPLTMANDYKIMSIKIKTVFDVIEIFESEGSDPKTLPDITWAAFAIGILEALNDEPRDERIESELLDDLVCSTWPYINSPDFIDALTRMAAEGYGDILPFLGVIEICKKLVSDWNKSTVLARLTRDKKRSQLIGFARMMHSLEVIWRQFRQNSDLEGDPHEQARFRSFVRKITDIGLGREIEEGWFGQMFNWSCDNVVAAAQASPDLSPH